MKELVKFDIWNGETRYDTKLKFKRVSRWIKLKTNYNPNKRNELWDYVQDDMGYRTCQSGFNPDSDLFLDYFTFNGRNYALEQFIAIGCIADAIGHSEGYIEDGKKHFLSGYDEQNYFRPLFIELDEYGERVRCYEYKEVHA